jgi:hypothetical protein
MQTAELKARLRAISAPSKRKNKNKNKEVKRDDDIIHPQFRLRDGLHSMRRCADCP